MTEFWQTARRPRWIAALVLVLAVAAGFAALAQWQLSRSVENATVADIDTETPVDLDSITEPRSPVTEQVQGRRVTVAGRLDPDGFVVLTGRDGDQAWLVGRLITPEGASLAVALGYTSDAGLAGQAAGNVGAGVQEWSGRYLPTESPQESDFEAGSRNALAVAELVNEWPTEPDPSVVYGGYLVADDPPSGLERIIALPPERQVTLNLLNVFYAIEWVLFAGFAFYLWYRLVRDAVERSMSAEDASGAPVD